MSYNPKPIQVSVPASTSITPAGALDGQQQQTSSSQPPPPISQPPKVNPPPSAAQMTQAVNNLHVLAAAGGGERLAQLHQMQQQMASFQTQALLYQQQAAAAAAASSQATTEPLALTRVVAEAAAKQANGSVTITPQPVASSAVQVAGHSVSLNPNVAHQVHSTSLKMTYHVQHKPASTSQTPAHLSSQPASVQHHQTASVATVSQAQAQHHPGSGQPPPPPPSATAAAASQQKVPSPQKAAPPPATRAPQAVATSTASQSQLQANNNVPKAAAASQKTPPPAKLATVVTPSKTTMKPATVTTPRIKQTARKNQTALGRPQSNFAAAVEAAATKPSTSAPVSTPEKAPPVTKTTPPSAPPPAPSVSSSAVEKEKPAVTEKSKPEAKEPKEQQAPAKKEKPQQLQKVSKASSSSQDTSDSGGSPSVARFKRSRTRTVPYQSPLPEYALLSKLSYAESNSSGSKTGDDRLVLFYKSEFLAVRNAEGGFFLCQAQHNVYKSSPRIRIQWLSEEKPNSTMYIPDFYDVTDLECILTSVELQKKAKKLYKLPEKEQERIQNILRKAIDVEKGILPRPDVTEENPDGLDLSLYKDESQLERHSRRKRGKAAAPGRSKRTKVESAETPKRASTRTTSPRKNFAESDFEVSDEEDDEPLKGRKSRPVKQTTTPVAAAKAPPAKKTPVSSPVKAAPAKSKGPSPKQSVQPTPEVVVPAVSATKGRPGRKRKAELILDEDDPLALPPAEKKATPETPAAAKVTKGAPAKKSPSAAAATVAQQSTKKTLVGKAKKAEPSPEAAKKVQAKATPAVAQSKAKVAAAKAQGGPQSNSKEAAGGRTTRGRK